VDSRLRDVKEKYVKCCKCQEILSLEQGDPQQLIGLEKEVAYLKNLWEELAAAQGFVDSIKDELLRFVTPAQIKESLEKAQARLDTLAE